MKKFRAWALVFAGMTAVCASAQDMIVKKDGTVIQAKVMKVGTSEVDYKKWSNQNGPQYSIAVADILAINYQNGEKETFDNVSAQPEASKPAAQPTGMTQVSVETLSAEAKAANDAAIEKYNQIYDTDVNEAKKNGNAKEAFMRLGVTEGSVLENEDIAISIATGYMLQAGKQPASFSPIAPYLCNVGIKFMIQNKTNNTLYLDLGNTFYVSMGHSVGYYVPTSTTTTNSSSSGVGINAGAIAGAMGLGGVAGKLAGGINFGGGSTSGTAVTTFSQRVVAIAPGSTYNLDPQYIFCNETRSISPGFLCSLKGMMATHYCKAVFSDENGGRMLNYDLYSYSEQSSPLQLSFVTSYSKNEDFASSSSLRCGLYLMEMYGEGLFKQLVKESKLPVISANANAAKKTMGGMLGLMGAAASATSTTTSEPQQILFFHVGVDNSKKGTVTFPKQ